MKGKATIVALLLTLLVAAPEAHAAGSNSWPALGAIAAEIAGPVDLTCDSMTDGYEGGDPAAFPVSRSAWLPAHVWAYTYPQGADGLSGPEVTLSPLACAALLTALSHPHGGERYELSSFSADPGGVWSNEAVEGWAIHAFTHEMRHVLVGYVADAEADAECFALAHERDVAQRYFHFSAARASRVARYGQAFHAWTPPQYRTVCP